MLFPSVLSLGLTHKDRAQEPHQWTVDISKMFELYVEL